MLDRPLIINSWGQGTQPFDVAGGAALTFFEAGSVLRPHQDGPQK